MSRARSHLAPIAVVASLCCVGGALAEAPAYCPRDAAGKIDITRPVDKAALAVAMIEKGQVSRTLETKIAAANQRPGYSPAAQALMLRDAFCGEGKKGCSTAEYEALVNAGNAFDYALTDAKTFTIAVTQAERDPVMFFASASAQLRCKAEEAETEKPEDDGKTKTWSLRNFRARGTSTDLIYSHGGDGFDDTDKVEISFEDDQTAGKKSTKFVGALGYAFPIGGTKPGSDKVLLGSFVPFVGVNFDTSKTKTDGKKVSSDLVEYGAILAYSLSVPKDVGGGHIQSPVWSAAAIPKVIVNHDDHSRVEGLNLLLRPTFSFINRQTEIGDSDIWWNVIGDVRLNSGRFAKIGDRDAEASKDFIRPGARLGLRFVGQADETPVELKISDIYMGRFRGGPDHLNLFDATVSIYFNKDRDFGIDLGYTKGRDEDLDEAEDKWSVGFAAKY
ncbi:hypothetical protein [Caulobacter sp. BK020]|uniref:hypothetical protein n=1 Tax=Caulobacter sp. BK020 TaxID=2512117 RepID=UPI0010526703|nr:hypothetical protein [Caulobacter sp. BK020]TCS10308.1 hypothetical protein EV278_11845 [Caulobacter sp. BK020]